MLDYDELKHYVGIWTLAVNFFTGPKPVSCAKKISHNQGLNCNCVYEDDCRKIWGCDMHVKTTINLQCCGPNILELWPQPFCRSVFIKEQLVTILVITIVETTNTPLI